MKSNKFSFLRRTFQCTKTLDDSGDDEDCGCACVYCAWDRIVVRRIVEYGHSEIIRYVKPPVCHQSLICISGAIRAACAYSRIYFFRKTEVMFPLFSAINSPLAAFSSGL